MIRQLKQTDFKVFHLHLYFISLEIYCTIVHTIVQRNAAWHTVVQLTQIGLL